MADDGKTYTVQHERITQGRFVPTSFGVTPIQFDAINALARADYRSWASCARRLLQIGLEAERERVAAIDKDLVAELDKMRNVA